jgi:hypothetical protein
VKAIYQIHKDLAHPTSNTTDELIANQDATCAGSHVKLSVDPSGKNYAITVPSTKHEKTYVTRTAGAGAAAGGKASSARGAP